MWVDRWSSGVERRGEATTITPHLLKVPNTLLVCCILIHCLRSIDSHTMRNSLSSSLLLATLASTLSTTLAAPSPYQLVLADSEPPQPAMVAAAAGNRDPDFVDIMEAEQARINKASSSSAVPAMWPGQPGEPGGGGGWVWSSCGQPDDLITVEDIKVSPDPPVPGKNMTVTAKGTVKGAIEVSKEVLTQRYTCESTYTSPLFDYAERSLCRCDRQDWLDQAPFQAIRHL